MNVENIHVIFFIRNDLYLFIILDTFRQIQPYVKNLELGLIKFNTIHQYNLNPTCFY